MRPVIPFVSETHAEEQAAWLQALPEAMRECADVKSFGALSDREREEAKVAIVANPDPAKLAGLPNLVWVQSLWAGVERLTAELPADGPLIVRLADPQMAETMSEAVLAWTLYLHRDMPRYMKQQRDKVWREHTLQTPQERTVGILGLGKLGSAAAHRLRSNGFNVAGWSRSPKALDGIDCLHGPDGLKEVLARADILVVLTPLTSETRGLLGTPQFGMCKPGAALINFARGPVIDTQALLKALDSGTLGHAVLDVFDEEPLPQTSPFWDHDRVTVLPHISAPTIVSTAAAIVTANIKGWFETGSVPESVDRTRGY